MFQKSVTQTYDAIVLVWKVGPKPDQTGSKILVRSSVVTDPGIYLFGPLGSIQNSKDPKRPRVSRVKWVKTAKLL